MRNLWCWISIWMDLRSCRQCVLWWFSRQWHNVTDTIEFLLLDGGQILSTTTQTYSRISLSNSGDITKIFDSLYIVLIRYIGFDTKFWIGEWTSQPNIEHYLSINRIERQPYLCIDFKRTVMCGNMFIHNWNQTRLFNNNFRKQKETVLLFLDL